MSLHRYGLVPNGGRVYYIRRSQPPLLTQMVDLYYNRTGNKTFLQDMLPSLKREYEFWMENRTVDVMEHTLNHYDAPTTCPRWVKLEEGGMGRGGGVEVRRKGRGKWEAEGKRWERRGKERVQRNAKINVCRKRMSVCVCVVCEQFWVWQLVD